MKQCQQFKAVTREGGLKDSRKEDPKHPQPVVSPQGPQELKHPSQFYCHSDPSAAKHSYDADNHRGIVIIHAGTNKYLHLT